MRLLLDTHTLLWWLSDDTKLSSDARETIHAPSSLVYVSVASVWEINIKIATGKLNAPPSLIETMQYYRFQELPITWEHGLAAGNLPLHHSDPFDCMLIAQARIEELVLVTRDPRFTDYNVPIIRA